MPFDEALMTTFAMGELTGPPMERVQAELATSPARRRELAEIRQVIGLLEQVHEEHEEHEEPRAERPPERSVKRRSFSGYLGAAALAAAVLLAFLFAAILSFGGDQGSAVPSLSSVAEASVYRNADAGAPPQL